VSCDPIERQQREVVPALSRRSVSHAALCGRWVISIAPEVVTRFEEALAQTPAQRGMIVTTSHFTDAARERAGATAYEVDLVDGDGLQRWIEEIW
jgi:restriction endonuclease Mrr